MSISISNQNPKTTILDITVEKENLNYILKFGLPTSIAQHIDLCLILHDIHIDNPTTVSDVKLNS